MIKIYFDRGSSIVDPSYMSNEESQGLLEERLRSLSQDSRVVISSVEIDGYASPYGDVYSNKRLSLDRADAVCHYVGGLGLVADSLVQVRGNAVDWEALRLMFIASDIDDKSDVLEIIDGVPEEIWGRLDPADQFETLIDSREKHLMDYRGGEVYNQMQDTLFPHLKYVSVTIDYMAERCEQPVEEATTPATEAESDAASALRLLEGEEDPDTKYVIYDGFPPRNPLLAVKSNLAGLALGVANIAVEVPFLQRYSVDMSLYYSPYTIKDDWKIRLSVIQPEFRYWLVDSMRSHFVGVHAHVGLFNVATDKWSRYQNSTNQPLWGGGVSYGYALYLSRALNLEFTLGAGYASLSYDSFYNVENGAQYNHTERGYWGITRAGVSLSYIINRK